MDWTDFISGIKDDTGTLAKDQLKTLVKTSLSDSDQFVKNSAEKLKTYLQQLANGEISKDDFSELVQDLHDLMDEKISQNAIVAKASAERLASGIKDLVLNGLLRLI